jgi:hypothetical protein
MESGPENRLALIRRYYGAYEGDDRLAIEGVLHPEFTFTSPSPGDDMIDRATYFERCWPPHERIESFDLLDVIADSDTALIRYRATVPGEVGFQCVEHFEFAEGLVSHIEVYFGRDPVLS